MHTLDPESQAALDRRKLRGEQVINVHPDYPFSIDAETAAADMISDVLTFLFGEAGIFTDGGLRYDADAHDQARVFLDRALLSWHGDAEDYLTAEA